MKSHLCRRIICVADAGSPGGEVEECQVPKVGARCEAVPGQLLVPGGLDNVARGFVRCCTCWSGRAAPLSRRESSSPSSRRGPAGLPEIQNKLAERIFRGFLHLDPSVTPGSDIVETGARSKRQLLPGFISF